MGFFKIKNITLDSYQTNNLVKSSFGTKSDDRLEDNIIHNYLEFVRCYQEALKKDEFGAFLIITGNQYVFAKCCDDGEQSHLLSITKAFLELEGKDSNVSVLEASKLYKDYLKKYLIFDFEIKKDEISRKRDKFIRTNLNQSTISKEEYQLFKMFFDEYNEVISRCDFDYSVWDKTTGRIISVGSIYQLEELLRNITDEKTKPNTLENGEKIIGIPLKKEENGKML